MSKLCRDCLGEMPKDRKGWEQVCPKCMKKRVNNFIGTGGKGFLTSQEIADLTR